MFETSASAAVSDSVVVIHSPCDGASFYSLEFEKLSTSIDPVGDLSPSPVSFDPHGRMALICQGRQVSFHDPITGRVLYVVQGLGKSTEPLQFFSNGPQVGCSPSQLGLIYPAFTSHLI
jgi:hypothetical protein